jgi:hypothetical protein
MSSLPGCHGRPRSACACGGDDDIQALFGAEVFGTGHQLKFLQSVEQEPQTGLRAHLSDQFGVGLNPLALSFKKALPSG